MPGYKTKRHSHTRKYKKKGKKVYRKKASPRGTVTGFGAYKINRNTLINANGGQTPVVKNSKTGVIIRHIEFLGDIFAVTNFEQQYTLPLNPANPQLCPWLAPIARQFDEYEWRGAIFEVRSTSTASLVVTGNSGMGTVMMATEYDVADNLYANKLELMNAEFACSAKPSKNFIHPIECARKQNTNTHLYTLPGSGIAPSNFDPRLYNLGIFQLAVEGMQGVTGSRVGELYFSYEVELFKPQITERVNIADEYSGSGAKPSEKITDTNFFQTNNKTFNTLIDLFGNVIAVVDPAIANRVVMAQNALKGVYSLIVDVETPTAGETALKASTSLTVTKGIRPLPLSATTVAIVNTLYPLTQKLDGFSAYLRSFLNRKEDGTFQNTSMASFPPPIVDSDDPTAVFRWYDADDGSVVWEDNDGTPYATNSLSRFYDHSTGLISKDPAEVGGVLFWSPTDSVVLEDLVQVDPHNHAQRIEVMFIYDPDVTVPFEGNQSITFHLTVENPWNPGENLPFLTNLQLKRVSPLIPSHVKMNTPSL